MVGYIAKNKQKYHTVRTISKSNGKIVEGESIDAPNTQIHERLLSWHEFPSISSFTIMQ
jgi:hypothetical protein